MLADLHRALHGNTGLIVLARAHEGLAEDQAGLGFAARVPLIGGVIDVGARARTGTPRVNVAELAARPFLLRTDAEQAVAFGGQCPHCGPDEAGRLSLATPYLYGNVL